jgi:translation initiation factor IF-2
MLEPTYKDVVAGKAEVLALFRITKIGTIAGCKVLNGKIRRNQRARVMRGGEKVYDGELSSLKHEKEDVNEVRTGFECGMGFKGFNDLQVGDIIESYTKEKVGE